MGGAGDRMKPIEGTRTEDRADDRIFFRCDCVDIGVPGGMDGVAFERELDVGWWPEVRSRAESELD